MQNLPLSTIPDRLAAYFHEYDMARIDLRNDANLVIQRIIEFGDWDELRWLFRLYGAKRIRIFVREYGERLLSPVSFNYWRQLLRIRKWKKTPTSISRKELWPY